MLISRVYVRLLTFLLTVFVAEVYHSPLVRPHPRSTHGAEFPGAASCTLWDVEHGAISGRLIKFLLQFSIS